MFLVYSNEPITIVEKDEKQIATIRKTLPTGFLFL
ncbi:Uncharacterised protein [Chlamydia trachomatis]|nr:Uncharacterised protein [Chlamydia trachomatis]